MGLGGGEGPSGRREGDLDAGVLVVGDERAGLSAPEQARDIVWALISPELYDALVVRRGWDPDDYEHWLAESLTDALLRRDHPTADSSPSH
jgi:hypothetical protein